jgi:putative phosphoribosyl transferase
VNTSPEAREVRIPGPEIAGDLMLPPSPAGLVVFAHGSGSGRFSARNRHVAEALHERALATLLLDLLRAEEEHDQARVFDIELLAGRLTAATEWAANEDELSGLPVGYFGASTGAAAALTATAELPDRISAVVSRGGRPDLAGPRLTDVRVPTLLIVGARDELVLELNREALRQLSGPAELSVVSGATHLFEEPGALAQVSGLAGDWFVRYLET